MYSPHIFSCRNTKSLYLDIPHILSHENDGKSVQIFTEYYST